MSVTTPMRRSRESSYGICPVVDLMIDFAPSYEVEQSVQAEIDPLQQLSVVVQWCPALKNIASMIGPVLDDGEEIDRFNANRMSLPIVRVLGSRDSILPSFIKLPALSKNTNVWIQKVVYLGLPNQCFHVARWVI